ncbi:hypothetical protein AHAS_Ahas04G0136800 [Arachis hypogaea]
MVLQSAQQMKKSTHGSRSRSSEYRGVTFYRRIEQYESRIWLTINDLVITFLLSFISPF